MTNHDIDDGSQAGALVDRVGGPLALFTADGAYDRDNVYGVVATRQADAAVIVPLRSSVVPSKATETAPTQRDRHLPSIAERIGWQTASGYNWRVVIEADIARFKRLIGDGLRSQTDARQATEAVIAVDALNSMLEFGRPEYVCVA